MPKATYPKKYVILCVILLSALMASGCYKSKMALPEVELMNKAEEMRSKGASTQEFCNYISSVAIHQRHILGRMYVSSPPIISTYALDCLKRGMLTEKFFIFNIPATEEKLLYRSALCGEEHAINLVVRNYDSQFKPRFPTIFLSERAGR